MYMLNITHIACVQGVVMAAVRVFYMRVMNDEILRPFFEDIDLARLKNKLVSDTMHKEVQITEWPFAVLANPVAETVLIACLRLVKSPAHV